MSALIVSMLRALKIRDIRESSNAYRTMVELKHRVFDVLLLDDGLKDTDSIEFTRRLRAAADCQNRHIPIIMMSGLPDAGSIARARDAGVTEFLRKPFSAQHVEMRLNSIFAAPRPFIETKSYQGPDRRRRKRGFDGDERRANEHPPEAAEN